MNKISLAGDLGSGKSTVAKLLVAALNAEYYSTGSIVRSIADRMGMSIVELNKYMEDHPEIDNEIDNGLMLLADDMRPMVIDSRMAWHFTEGTFKVYLSTDAETSAIRIMNANRHGEHQSTLEETIESTKARRESERKRYMLQYGVDITDLSNYTLIVDTTSASPEEIAGVIISAFRAWQLDRSFSAIYMSPERLNYSDDEQDTEKVAELSCDLDVGRPIPPVTVFEEHGEFYVKDGIESALAYALGLYTFIPARLAEKPNDGKDYIKMRNSL